MIAMYFIQFFLLGFLQEARHSPASVSHGLNFCFFTHPVAHLKPRTEYTELVVTRDKSRKEKKTKKKQKR